MSKISEELEKNEKMIISSTSVLARFCEFNFVLLLISLIGYMHALSLLPNELDTIISIINIIGKEYLALLLDATLGINMISYRFLISHSYKLDIHYFNISRIIYKYDLAHRDNRYKVEFTKIHEFVFIKSGCLYLILMLKVGMNVVNGVIDIDISTTGIYSIHSQNYYSRILVIILIIGLLILLVFYYAYIYVYSDYYSMFHNTFNTIKTAKDFETTEASSTSLDDYEIPVQSETDIKHMMQGKVSE